MNFVKLITIVVLLFITTQVFATGALFSRPRWSNQQYEKMWIKSMDISIDIREQIAVTHVDQVFYNEMNSSVETVYIFPLPENAMITEMAYWVGDVRYVAEIRERQDAVNAYNHRIQQWLDPALLEYLGDNLFRLKIAPVNALSEVRTEISYVEPLTYDLGIVEYSFQLNTLELSSQPLETVSLQLNAESNTPYKSFSSPSHQSGTATQINQLTDKHYTLFYGDENFFPDKDLIVRMEPYKEDVDFQVLTYTPAVKDSFGTDSFYTLWITPPDQVEQEEIIPKNIIFAADVSSSMEGERLFQLKEALDNFLNLLLPKDRFNIVTFGTFVETFRPDFVDASQQNVSDARQFVNNLFALGLTNINDALTTSLEQSYQDTTSNNIIFLTDGMPTWGETDITKILDNISTSNQNDVRIFSFGIGLDINRSLLANISNANHGYSQFISSDDSIALVVNSHFKRISKPILKDISITMNGLDVWDTYPKILGDLYFGSQVVQMGLYRNSGSFKVSLKGHYRSDSVVYNKTISFPDTVGGHRFVPRLWAKAKINHLLDLISSYGETNELVDQVVDLSLRFQILTEYTAFYIDPDEQPTAIEDDVVNPEKFALRQNYPNPFNPQTTISYTLPPSGQLYDVTIKIYDMLGRLVMVLVKSRQAAGTYSIVWSGTDAFGNALPSGIYLYTLQAGRYKETKKMILLK